MLKKRGSINKVVKVKQRAFKKNMPLEDTEDESFYATYESTVDQATFKELVKACEAGKKKLEELEKYYEEGNEGILAPQEGGPSLLSYLLTKESMNAYNIIAIAAPYQPQKRWFLKMLIYGCKIRAVPLTRLKKYYDIVGYGDVDKISFSWDDPFSKPVKVKKGAMTLGRLLDQDVYDGDEPALYIMYYVKKSRTIDNIHPSPQQLWLDEKATDDDQCDLILESMKNDARYDELEYCVSRMQKTGETLNITTIKFGHLGGSLWDFCQVLKTSTKPGNYPYKEKVLDLLRPMCSKKGRFWNLITGVESGDAEPDELKHYYAEGGEGNLEAAHDAKQSFREYLLDKGYKGSHRAYEILAIAASHQLDKKTAFKTLVYLCIEKGVCPKYIKKYYEVIGKGDVDRINFSPDNPFIKSEPLFNPEEKTLGQWLDTLDNTEAVKEVRYYVKTYRTAGKPYDSPNECWLDVDASDTEISTLILESMENDARHPELQEFRKEHLSKNIYLIPSGGILENPLGDVVESLDEDRYPHKEEVLALLGPLGSRSLLHYYLTKKSAAIFTSVAGVAGYFLYQYFLESQDKEASQK